MNKMEKFRIISKKELVKITHRYFGECRLVYSYKYHWVHILIKEQKVTEETFKAWLHECFGEYLTDDCNWHPLDGGSRAEYAKRLGFTEWKKGEYYKLSRPIKDTDARFEIQKWADWADEAHERSVIWLSDELVRKGIEDYRIKAREDLIYALWD